MEGASTSVETMRGARLAADNGWVAPSMPDTPPAFPTLEKKS